MSAQVKELRDDVVPVGHVDVTAAVVIATLDKFVFGTQLVVMLAGVMAEEWLNCTFNPTAFRSAIQSSG